MTGIKYFNKTDRAAHKFASEIGRLHEYQDAIIESLLFWICAYSKRGSETEAAVAAAYDAFETATNMPHKPLLEVIQKLKDRGDHPDNMSPLIIGDQYDNIIEDPELVMTKNLELRELYSKSETKLLAAFITGREGLYLLSGFDHLRSVMKLEKFLIGKSDISFEVFGRVFENEKEFLDSAEEKQLLRVA